MNGWGCCYEDVCEPTVSVLVPVHGVEAWIVACAESLFRQTYRSIEYIFVDDCSPDAGVELIEDTVKRFPHRREQVRILRHDVNKGLGGARQTGLLAATGDFVCFVDGDDVLYPQAIETMCKIQRETGADCVDAAFEELYADGRKRTVMPFVGSERAYLRRILMRNVLTHNIWGKLFKRSLFTDHGLNFEQGVDLGEDYSMVARVCYFARRAVCNVPLYGYRVGENSHFAGKLNRQKAISSVRSYGIVNRFYRRDRAHTPFDFAMQLGLLLCYINTGKGGMLSLEDAEALLGVPITNPLLRLVQRLVRDNSKNTLPKVLYRLIKRCYLIGR